MKKEQFIFIFVIIFLHINLTAASRWLQSVPPTRAKSHPQNIHDSWDKLLQKYVRQGKVNYKKIKYEKTTLDTYIQLLSTHLPAPNASKAERMAFWLNAYNALTVQRIVEHYPIKSIKDLDHGNTWDIERYTFGGKKYSLNQIENDILRPLGDARIHFALNCAAKSCPPLHTRAFDSQLLDTQLEQLTRAFINKTSENQLIGNTIQISNIFNWYKNDFGDVLAFLNRYAHSPVHKTAKITYKNYDWSLNEL